MGIFDFSSISSNIHLLGEYSKSHRFPSKHLLSVDKNGEWKIRTLNTIQLLLRKIFGCYKDTHLNTIATAWNAYQCKHGNVCPELNDKIAQIWAKHHSTPILSPLAKVVYFGNSKLSDADVIGICQLHSDPKAAKFTAKIITENYREGDVILVEGIDADKMVTADTIPQTLYFPKNAEIQGWEPVGFQALSAFIFEPTLSIISQFESSSSIFLKMMSNVNFEREANDFKFVDANNAPQTFTIEQKTEIWNNWLLELTGSLIETIGKISTRFVQNNRPDNSTSALQDDDHPFAKQLDLFMDAYKTFALSPNKKEEADHLTSLFKDLYKRCSECIIKNKHHKGWTEVQNNFFANTWDVRQQSLANEIKRYRDQQKRIFVCAGAALFFPKRDTESSPTLNTIREHKFTLGIQNNKKNATYYSFANLAQKYGSPA